MSGKDMVRRAAEAIDKATAFYRQRHDDLDPPSVILARAAIEAMREPPEFLREIGASAYTLNDPEDDWRPYMIGYAWDAMIDAALNPSSTEPGDDPKPPAA